MSKYLSAEELRDRLRKACEKAGSRRAWARANSVDEGQLSRILAGREPVSDTIATRLGFCKRYVREASIDVCVNE